MQDETIYDPNTFRLYIHDDETVGGNPVHIHMDHVDGLSAWAKAETKPSYTYSEVGAAAVIHDHDDLYYTDDEVDSLLTNYSLTTHDHDDLYSLLGHNHAGVYEPVITKGTTAQYFRGDMSLATFPSIPTELPTPEAFSVYIDISEQVLSFDGSSAQSLHLYGSNEILLDHDGSDLFITHNQDDGYLHVPAYTGGGFLKSISAGVAQWEEAPGAWQWVASINGSGGMAVNEDTPIMYFNAGDNLDFSLSGWTNIQGLGVVSLDAAVVGCVNDTPYVVQDYINFPHSGGNYQLAYGNLPFYETNAIDTMLGYKQDTIRACADAEANNGEIFISTSVTYGRLSFKDANGGVTRTT